MRINLHKLSRVAAAISMSLLALFASTLDAKTFDSYRRPVPELPLFQDPSNVNDLYTYSMIFQLHAALFRMDEAQHPVPYLVENFAVSPDQKKYSFQLRKARFHNGKPVTSRVVKRCIENAIRKHAINFESLTAVNGFSEFLAKKSSGLAGITEEDELRFSIGLSRPDPELISKLTDIRFAIWDIEKTDATIGAGPYSLSRRDKSQVVLKRFEQTNMPDAELGPKELVFYLRTSADALADFHAGKADDLFFYSISEKLIPDLAKIAKVQSIYFPRTYFLTLASERIPNRKDREALLDRIDASQLVAACFPTNVASANLVPPGFMGHQPEKEKTVGEKKKPRTTSLNTLRIYVVESIGEEDCIVRLLKEKLAGSAQKIVVERKPLSVVIEAWKKRTVEGFISYLEGESTVHYFGSFNPNAEFRFGLAKDANFARMFDQFDRAGDSYSKQKRAEELSDYILSWATFKPLFHPKNYLIYQEKFDRLKTPFQSAALIPLTEFLVSKKAEQK